MTNKTAMKLIAKCDDLLNEFEMNCVWTARSSEKAKKVEIALEKFKMTLLADMIEDQLQIIKNLSGVENE